MPIGNRICDREKFWYTNFWVPDPPPPGWSANRLPRVPSSPQFSTFDIDGNGWLDKDQFRLIYQTCNPLDAGDDEHIEDVLAQYDMLGDDRISYHEFANIMLRLARE